MYNWSLWLSSTALVCIVLASCFQCVWYMNEPIKQTKIDERVKRLEDADKQEDKLVEDQQFNTPFFSL